MTFKQKSDDHEQNIPVDYFLPSLQVNSTSYLFEDIEKHVNSEKRTIVEQSPEGIKERGIEKGEGYTNSEENLEEMIGMKTKVSTSTIITLLEDTSPTSSTSTSSEENGNDDGGSSTSGESIPAYTSTRKDFTSSGFGLDLVTEPTDSAKMFLPTHTSLSATTTTTSSRQAVGFSDDVVEGMMTTMRVNVLEEMTKDQHEINGVSDDFSKTEIIEPFLLECQNSEEGDDENGDDDGKGGNLSTTTAHPHRHGHHNSNYNRYQSNRRRRRWRNNNHNGGGVNNGGGNQRFGIDDNDQHSKMYNRNGRKRSTVLCPTTAGKKAGQMDREQGNQRQYRRGVWKVGNWTLCESKECFTWNTGNICT